MPRTREVEVYDYNELEPDAQERALDDFRQDFEFFGGDEAVDSLKAYADHFGVTLRDYNLDPSNANLSDAKFELDWDEDEYTEEYIEEQLDAAGNYDPETFKGHGDCLLTGVCYDENLFDGFRIEFMDGERDMMALLQSGFYELAKAVEADYEYQTSSEAFAETAEANEYEFNEDGSWA
jgi:hypothetical protein